MGRNLVANRSAASFEDTSSGSALADRETGGIDVWAASVALSPHPKLQVGLSVNLWSNGSVLAESSASDSFACVTSASGTRTCTQDTSRLAWARNIAIPGRGHVDILASERLAAIVLKELREAGVVVRD